MNEAAAAFFKEASPLVRNLNRNQQQASRGPPGGGRDGRGQWDDLYQPEFARGRGGGEEQQQRRAFQRQQQQQQQQEQAVGNPLAMENPIMTQAKRLLGRVMSCASPEDEAAVARVVASESDANLAVFIAQTLEQSVRLFKWVWAPFSLK